MAKRERLVGSGQVLGRAADEPAPELGQRGVVEAGQVAIEKGAERALVQDMPGHATDRMTRRYTQTVRSQDAARQAGGKPLALIRPGRAPRAAVRRGGPGP